MSPVKHKAKIFKFTRNKKYICLLSPSNNIQDTKFYIEKEAQELLKLTSVLRIIQPHLFRARSDLQSQ